MGLRPRALENLRFDLARNDDDAVQVAEDGIAGADVDAADPDGAAEIDDRAACPLILRIPPAREAWKPKGEDAGCIARPAVDHHAGGAAVARAHGHELSPRRIGP